MSIGPSEKILIVSANPKDTDKLRLDEKIREIQAALRRANNRWYQFKTCVARLLDHQPTIVHFSGHGLGLDFRD